MCRGGFGFILMKSSIFCLQSIVKFQHVGQAANSFANGLVKQGEDRSLDLVAIII